MEVTNIVRADQLRVGDLLLAEMRQPIGAILPCSADKTVRVLCGYDGQIREFRASELVAVVIDVVPGRCYLCGDRYNGKPEQDWQVVRVLDKADGTEKSLRVVGVSGAEGQSEWLMPCELFVAPATPEVLSERYVRRKGAQCPLCGARDIVGGAYEGDADTVFMRVECQQCEASWYDVYQLTAATEIRLQTGKPYAQSEQAGDKPDGV